MHASKKNLCNNVLKDLMKTARKDDKTVWKIHTFVWKRKHWSSIAWSDY